MSIPALRTCRAAGPAWGRTGDDRRPGSAPGGKLAAWLVTDVQGELMPRLRELAGAKGLEPYAGRFRAKGLVIECHPVVHTSHPAFGYLIRASGKRVVWAPEFFEFPVWVRDVELMFAEAAGWSRPIGFRGGVGGHLDALAVAEAARRRGVRRLVFAHIGRPTLRAIDQGKDAALRQDRRRRPALHPPRPPLWVTVAAPWPPVLLIRTLLPASAPALPRAAR